MLRPMKKVVRLPRVRYRFFKINDRFIRLHADFPDQSKARCWKTNAELDASPCWVCITPYNLPSAIRCFSVQGKSETSFLGRG